MQGKWGIDIKLAEGFLVKEIADSYVLIPVGQNVMDYRNIISTNKTGNFILNELDVDITYDDLFATVCLEYEADEQAKELVKQDLEFLFYKELINYLYVFSK